MSCTFEFEFESVLILCAVLSIVQAPNTQVKSNCEENFFTTAAACQTWKRCRHSRQTALELVFLVFVSLWKSFHWIVFAYSDYYFNYDFCIILLICWWPCWSWFIPQQLLESIQVHTWSWRCTPLSEPTIPPWGISLEVFTASTLDFVLTCVFVKGEPVLARIKIGKNSLEFPIISSYPYF